MMSLILVISQFQMDQTHFFFAWVEINDSLLLIYEFHAFQLSPTREPGLPKGLLLLIQS